MSTKREIEAQARPLIQFFCEGCRLWLTEGGTVHDDGEHEDAPGTKYYRHSYDDGKTWRDDLPLGRADIQVKESGR